MTVNYYISIRLTPSNSCVIT